MDKIELSVNQLKYIAEELIKSETETLAILETSNIKDAVDVKIGNRRFLLSRKCNIFDVSQ